MVLAADLNNAVNRLQAQQPSRTALQQLIANPLVFLGAHQLIGNAGNGHMSVIRRTPFELRANGDVRMGINAHGVAAAASPLCIVTPTRANTGAGLTNRLAPTERFTPGQGGTQLWLTDQQTGCSVLILDWGATFSMVHILPHLQSSYGRAMGGLMWAGGVRAQAGVQNSYLRSDVHAVARATMVGAAAPQRYILVQSQYSLNALQLLQVVGVAAPGTWDFYVQRIQMTPAGANIHGVQQLPWRAWQNDWTWHNATY